MDSSVTTHETHVEPARAPSRRILPLVVIGLMITAGVAAVGLIFAFGFRFGLRERYTGPTSLVMREILKVTIVERGTLESAENSDIVVRVKAGSKGSTIASTIKWVIDDGTQVKMGDSIVELDDSGFQESLKTQKNTVNKATSDWIEAKSKVTIAISQNESDIKSAEVLLNLAELDLRKYVGTIPALTIFKIPSRNDLQKYLAKAFDDDVRKELGGSDKLTSEYLQEINDIEGRIEIARSDRETWLDRASWSQRMVKKGFFSLSQADADQSRLASAEISLRKVQGELDIYRKFKLERQSTKLWGDLKEAERALQRTKTQAESKLEQAHADETAKRAIYEQEVARLHDMEKDEKFYKITSPQDGLIVYYVPEQSRFGSGSQQSIVAQGEPVREGQKLIRIPNLNKMLVNARVHEAMVSKVRGDVTRPTAYSDRLRSLFMLGRHDVLAMAVYQEAFDIIRDKFKEKEVTVMLKGQEARIRIAAVPGRIFTGRVRTVASVASQADFLSSDVKVYQTMVSIDDLEEGGRIKPGMSADVTILADETQEPVLVIPIQSVVGNVAMGEKRKCFVIDEAGYADEREIVIGLSNDKLVAVTSGLDEGEKIVLNPRAVLPEKSDLKPGIPSTRRGAEMEEGGKKGKGKKDGTPGKGETGTPPPGKGPGGASLQRPTNTAPNPADRLQSKGKE